MYSNVSPKENIPLLQKSPNGDKTEPPSMFIRMEVAGSGSVPSGSVEKFMKPVQVLKLKSAPL
jgi:hypothetical protein